MDVVRKEYTSKVDGLTDWYMLHDAGVSSDCVVYLHGHGSHGDQLFTRADIKWFGETLAEKKFSILSPNLRDNSWMGPAAAADLYDLIRSCKAEYQWRRIFIVSGSMGGTGALIFAVLHPEMVDGICMLGAASDVKRYRDFCLNNGTMPVHKAIYEAITANYPDEAAYAKHSACGNAEKLTMPLVYYHGIDDPVMNISEMQYLRDLLADSPQAVFIEVPGTHDAPLPYFEEGLLKMLDLCRA